jgi:hypothetical protein
MASIPAVVKAVETLTGLTLNVDMGKHTLNISRRGEKLEGLVFSSNVELLKNLYRVLVIDSKKQLALFRLTEAVDKSEPWTEWFLMAIEEGWDPQELATVAQVPTATNVHVLNQSPHS